MDEELKKLYLSIFSYVDDYVQRNENVFRNVYHLTDKQVLELQWRVLEETLKGEQAFLNTEYEAPRDDHYWRNMAMHCRLSGNVAKDSSELQQVIDYLKGDVPADFVMALRADMVGYPDIDLSAREFIYGAYERVYEVMGEARARTQYERECNAPISSVREEFKENLVERSVSAASMNRMLVEAEVSAVDLAPRVTQDIIPKFTG